MKKLPASRSAPRRRPLYEHPALKGHAVVTFPILVGIVAIVGGVFGLIVGWRGVRHAFQHPVYQLLPEHSGVAEDEPDKVTIQAAYRDGTRSDLGSLTCSWRTSPRLAIPLQPDANGCGVTVIGSAADLPPNAATPLPITVFAFGGSGRNLANARLLLYPFRTPAIVARLDLPFGQGMQVATDAPSLPGLDMHCVWQPDSLFSPPNRCRTLMTAPASSGLLAQALPITVSIYFSQSDRPDQTTLTLERLPFVVQLHPSEGPFNPGTLVPPSRASAASAAPAAPLTAATPSNEATHQASERSGNNLDIGALLASLGATTGPTRYLHLVASLKPTPRGQISVLDMAKLLDGIVTERLRLDALETLLLPLAPRPIPSADAMQLLVGIHGQDRLELLGLLAPCLSRPISPSDRDDIIGDATGPLWHEMDGTLDDPSRNCSFPR